jgi:hypothetical protein
MLESDPIYCRLLARDPFRRVGSVVGRSRDEQLLQLLDPRPSHHLESLRR